MRYFILLLVSFLLLSCDYFEVKKVSSKEIYQEEVDAINWKEVDQFPLFASCPADEDDREKELECFQSVIGNHLQQQVKLLDRSVSAEVQDTVLISLRISEQGQIGLRGIQMNEETERQIPALRRTLEEGISSLPTPQPALKRGIPVVTEFSLPLAIRTTAL
ncbi:hypothetical protein [Aureitalea marina]|uniref:TonB C-terminal domain-containing protein n=1 Tax=Aureitalea marina TaxID=930804 RepID=A0A2S7KLF1_9FLAO|nr:hypothetical protein [Aureitalea marina]PQB03464.1 hypothetical protein BST85_00070 [Aureitalea marina]